MPNIEAVVDAIGHGALVRHVPLCLQRCRDFIEGQVERDLPIFREGKVYEPHFPIVSGNLWVEGVNQQRARRCELGRYAKRPLHGVLQQMTADPVALLPLIHRKSCKNEGWHRIRRVPSQTRSAIFVRNRSGC